MHESKIFLLTLFFFILILCIFLMGEIVLWWEKSGLSGSGANQNLALATIKIRDITFRVELADTPEKKIQGLSGKASLSENNGMLFLFEKADIYSFWMKDMRFPIDIIWIDENFKIVGIVKNINPNSFPQTFQPQTPIQYVLEVNAGFSDRNNIVTGDQVHFLFSSTEQDENFFVDLMFCGKIN